MNLSVDDKKIVIEAKGNKILLITEIDNGEIVVQTIKSIES